MTLLLILYFEPEESSVAADSFIKHSTVAHLFHFLYPESCVLK